jgi:hypothetical protein
MGFAEGVDFLGEAESRRPALFFFSFLFGESDWAILPLEGNRPKGEEPEAVPDSKFS